MWGCARGPGEGQGCPPLTIVRPAVGVHIFLHFLLHFFFNDHFSCGATADVYQNGGRRGPAQCCGRLRPGTAVCVVLSCRQAAFKESRLFLNKFPPDPKAPQTRPRPPVHLGQESPRQRPSLLPGARDLHPDTTALGPHPALSFPNQTRPTGASPSRTSWMISSGRTKFLSGFGNGRISDSC